MTRLLAAGAVAVIAAETSSAGANSEPKAPQFKSSRDIAAIDKDIKDGKTKSVTTHKHTSGVWNGCTYVYLKTDIKDVVFDDDSHVAISENPEPLPPKGPDCVDRNPTPAEMADMRERLEQMNARERLPGSPPLPTITP